MTGGVRRPDRKGPRRSRRGLWFSLLVVLVVAAGAGTLLAVQPEPVRELMAGSKPSPPAVPSPPPPPPVLAAAGDAAAPTAEGLAKAVGALVRDRRLGKLTASIVDLKSGRTLYERASKTPVLPASVNKMVTAAAVLASRGPSHRLVTRAVAGQKPGEVVLIGGGDPTLAVDENDTYRNAARLDRLAAEVKKNLGGTRPTRVLVDSSIFTGPKVGPAWDPDIASYGYGAPITGLMVNGGRVRARQTTPRSDRPDIAAGRAFAKLLGAPQETVAAGRAAADAKQLAAVTSPPVLRLVEVMLRDSDNVVAEALARQVALAEGAEASFTGAADATRSVLEKLRMPTEGVELADGSGLSRENRLTSKLLAELLVAAASDEHSALSGMFGGLPVAGYSGTLDDRFTRGSNAAGLVRAKTGTLSGVSALSGVVVDADGRLLGFSFIANNVPGGTYAAEAALDKLAAALAGCGCS